MSQQVVSLWIGDRLGVVERVSLASFVANGHPMALYTYGPIAGVPAGVELRDAEPIMGRRVAEANRYPSGSYALFANIFRLVLQRKGLGLWVDADVVCLKPIDLEGPFIAGRESDRFLNNAVLKLDPELPLLGDWIAAFEGNRLPEWVPFSRDPVARIKEWLGLSQPPRLQPRGTYGPKAVTALAERHGLTGAAQPEQVFYPVHPRLAERLWDPTYRLADVVTERTLAVHLWNEKLKDLRKIVPPEGSIMAELMQRYRIAW